MSVLGECFVAFLFGSLVGLLVQRSRFCNTAALRDAMLFKTYRNTKALLLAMMILTLGFTAFMSIGEGKPMRFDVGFNQIVGLFLFGIGMVLAGACTVSTWVKAGEGNFGAVWALIFTFVGMFLFSLLWSFIYWPPAPDSMTGVAGSPTLGRGLASPSKRCRASHSASFRMSMIKTASRLVNAGRTCWMRCWTNGGPT